MLSQKSPKQNKTQTSTLGNKLDDMQLSKIDFLVSICDLTKDIPVRTQILYFSSLS